MWQISANKIIIDGYKQAYATIFIHQFLLGIDSISRSSSSLYDTTDWIITNIFANQPELVKAVLNDQAQESNVWYMHEGCSKVFPR